MFNPITILIFLSAFLIGIFAKLGDIAYDDDFKISTPKKILLGITWGVLGLFIVIHNQDMSAFYSGIILSWITRTKLDNYSHGIGASIILLGVFANLNFSNIQLVVLVATYLLFTGFGLLTRYKVILKNWFVDYNIYSFIFIGIISYYYHNFFIIFIASLCNVIGYHVIKVWWKRKTKPNKK